MTEEKRREQKVVLADWLLVADVVSEPKQSAFVPFVISSPGRVD